MKHFISLADISPTELNDLLQLAMQLKQGWLAGNRPPLLQGKSLAMVFMKPSLRTRVSFEMAMVHLGGYAFYLSPAEIKMGSRESGPNVARVLSGYVDGVMARVFQLVHITQLAEYASVPIINGLSDYAHPAQALADLFTILEHKGQLEGLKLAFIGDGNNVARSLLFGAMKTGMDFALGAPAGYTLSDSDMALAQAMRISGRQRIEFTEDPIAAVAGADVIYTDVWTSMGQEEETATRLAIFPPYQVNQALLDHAKEDCLVMHCLPAHRGEEITDEVADGPNSVLFPQAENRLHAQKAILVRLLAA